MQLRRIRPVIRVVMVSFECGDLSGFHRIIDC
jgi:hypothetical protein